MTDAATTWFGGRTVPVVPLVSVAPFVTALTGPIGANGIIGTGSQYSERRHRRVATVHGHPPHHPKKPATGTNDAIGTGYLSQSQALGTHRVVKRNLQAGQIGRANGTNGTIGTGAQNRDHRLQILDLAAAAGGKA